MNDIAIRIRNLGKCYRMGSGRPGHSNLRELINNSVASLFKKQTWDRRARHGEKKLWALKDVDLDIPEGEVFGIIGANGSGKTTLLRMLSRISRPTTGSIDLYGSTSSLLEVGTGFHPELSGRENIFLSGLTLGMQKAAIQKNFQRIVDFSGIEKFIEMPVKHYSNGMTVRLGFSVAAHLDSDILLLDEVLAVGDSLFQHKCHQKLADIMREGRTVLLVSHDLAAIERLCSRAMLLKEGRIECVAEPRKVIAQYLEDGSKPQIIRNSTLDSTEPQSVTLTDIQVQDCEGNPAQNIPFNEALSLLFEFRVHEKMPGLFLTMKLKDRNSRMVLGSTSFESPEIHSKLGSPGQYKLKVTIPPLLLVPRDYFVRIALGSHETDLFIFYERAATFRVINLPPYIDPGEAVHPTLKWDLLSD